MAEEMSIRDLAAKVFACQEEADRWLRSPNLWLDAKSPYELIESGRSEDIRRMLRQIGECIYI